MEQEPPPPPALPEYVVAAVLRSPSGKLDNSRSASLTDADLCNVSAATDGFHFRSESARFRFLILVGAAVVLRNHLELKKWAQSL